MYLLFANVDSFGSYDLFEGAYISMEDAMNNATTNRYVTSPGSKHVLPGATKWLLTASHKPGILEEYHSEEVNISTDEPAWKILVTN